MNRRGTRRPQRGGFTLIEVLLVLVILVILGSLATVYIRGARESAMVDAASAQISLFKKGLDMYDLDMNGYPTTSQGLQALVEPPSDLRNPDKWTNPYLDVPLRDGQRMVPSDPWDNPYQYQLVDSSTYRIWSFGPDGVDGTEDDISN